MHSVGGRPRIRPAVVRWLSEAGHKFISAPDTGTIVVQVLPFAAENSTLLSAASTWTRLSHPNLLDLCLLAVMKCMHAARLLCDWGALTPASSGAAARRARIAAKRRCSPAMTVGMYLKENAA